MFIGKTKQALDLLSGHGKRRLLYPSEIVDAKNNTTVRDFLEIKNPPAAPLYHEYLESTVSDPSLASHPIIFDALDEPVIRAAALHTLVSVDPSGVDAYGWRQGRF